MAAARAANEPVTFIGAVGDDVLGRESLVRFRQENMICDYLKTVEGQATGVALILVDDHGQNMISVASGANSRLRPADIDAIPEDVFAGAKVLLTCLETPLETVARALARAKSAGLITILNPAPAPAQQLPAELLRNVDVLTPNETEVIQLVPGSAASATSTRPEKGDDVPPTADDQTQLIAEFFVTGIERTGPDPFPAARQLREWGCGAVIVTLGAHGCLILGNDIHNQNGFAVDAVDATAAGDAFNGALAVALSEGKSLYDAALWAQVAAAISVTRLGAQPSLPVRDEIEELYGR